MTWTYNGAPDTSSAAGRLDAVRLLIKDTTPTSPQLTDEEIAFFLTENGSNVWLAAADGCDQLSARQASAISVGDLSLSDTAINYQDLATRYRRRAASHAVPFAGGISLSDKETYEGDTDRTVPFFARETGTHPEVEDT